MRTTFDPVSIFHTCDAHPGGHVGTFTPTALVRLGCGCRRWRMRRCDGTRMEAVDGDCARHAADRNTVTAHPRPNHDEARRP